MKLRFRKPCRVLIPLMLVIIMISGCGSSQSGKLESYRTELSSFFDRLTEDNASLEGIDASADDAEQNVLNIIDAIAEDCSSMASQEIPDELSELRDPLESASAGMEQARDAYHRAFESDPFDTELYAQADQYYQQANQDLQTVLSILRQKAEQN